MHKIATVFAIAALGVSGAAFAAEGPSQSFVELGYGITDVQLPGENVGANGFVLGGSVKLAEKFVVKLGYATSSYDNEIGIDQAEISLGVGYICSLSDSVDLTTALSLENLSLDPDGASSEDDTGFGLSLLVSNRVTDKLELNTGVKYSSIDFNELGAKISGFEVSAGGRYYFTPNLAGGLDIVGDKFFAGLSQATIVASVRYSFDK